MEGRLWEAAIVQRKRTNRNRVVRRMLKLFASRDPPTSPDQSDGSRIAKTETAIAAARVAMVIQLGSLGSLVASNLVPPIKTGILKFVSGILNLESPRFGTSMIATSPRVRMISGSRSVRSMLSSSYVRASPPQTP